MARYPASLEDFLSRLIRSNAPIDIRYVVETKADLIDPTSFGSEGQYDILTYKGIIVAVVDDSDYNNGVYYLQGDNPKVYDSWIKLISFPSEHFGGNEIVLQWDSEINAFIWKQKETSLAELTDTDVDGVQNNYFLKWDATIEKWVPAPIGGGGSGSGVTTEEIDYNLVFTPVSQGGLGYPNADVSGEVGTEGHGLGFLKPSDFNVGGVNGKIPVGTSYTDIFKAILEGEEMLKINAPDLTLEYNGNNQSYPVSTLTVTPTDALKYYSTSESGTYIPYTGQLIRKDPGVSRGYFKAYKDGRYSVAKMANLTITKVKVTLKSDSASKAYDGTPLVSSTLHRTGNDPHNVFNTASVTGSIVIPGQTSNTIQYYIPTEYQQYYDVTKQEGTLRIYPGVKYSITPGVDPTATGGDPISVTMNQVITDTNNNALNQSIGVDPTDPDRRTDNVYYVSGKNGLVEGANREFKIFIYGNAGIDTDWIWYYDSTAGKWKRSLLNNNEWSLMRKESTQPLDALGNKIEVWTYTGHDPVRFINLAFQTKNNLYN